MCRREFFPAQPQPDFEHGATQDDASDSDTDDDHHLFRMANIVGLLCQVLALDNVVCEVSQVIAARSMHMNPLLDSSRLAGAAVYVFVASHLVGPPVTIEQICPAIGLSRRTIFDTYRLFYRERETIIDEEVLSLVHRNSERATTGSPPPLAWPRPEYNEGLWEIIAYRLGIEPENTLIEISRRILVSLLGKGYLNPDNNRSNADHVLNIAALSFCVASSLRHVAVSCREVASAIGVSVNDIRTIYALFYPHREDLLEHSRLNSFWINNNLATLIHDLPLELPPTVE